MRYAGITKGLFAAVAVAGIGLALRAVMPSCEADAADAANEPGESSAAAAASTAPAEPAGRYDFSDSTSWNLTVSAWEHLAAKDFDGAFAFAGKCIELYGAKAAEMARTMRKFATAGHEDEFALVNDVATAHYVRGEAYMKQGKREDALREFNLIIAEYPYAQCWDPKGWFWKVAEVSRKNIEKIGKQDL